MRGRNRPNVKGRNADTGYNTEWSVGRDTTINPGVEGSNKDLTSLFGGINFEAEEFLIGERKQFEGWYGGENGGTGC